MLDAAALAHAAAEAFPAYSTTSAEERAAFLERIAVEIDALGDELLQTAHEETALPLARLTGERGRTTGQLRMFAALLRDGSWVDARIERADPARTPLPKPDLRRMLVPIGPVAVFGASNFPFAFSVPGGDTASALAAGCPVVVKAHPSHPKTSELVAGAIRKAVADSGLPAGVFGLAVGGVEIGQDLVKHPEIRAVAFTGSQKGGRALFDLAAARPRPIPVFAEMGSVNPVFVFQGALVERGETLAKGYADSLTLGVGQFCTNPGIIVGPDSAEFSNFLLAVAGHLGEVPAATMLDSGIHARYVAGVEEWSEHESLETLCRGERARPALFVTTSDAFLADPKLQEELFGPAAIAVRCETLEGMVAVAKALEGQLTATVQYEASDAASVQTLLPDLVRMAGRIVGNGFPTGVEVNSAMQHGGPYPASTDARTTSVGTAAIERFVRPVAFQNLPDALLPAELHAGNPFRIRRLVDGQPEA